MTWGHPNDRYRHPVGWGAWTETPPVITEPVIRHRPADWLFTGLARPAWAYRVELTLIGLLAVAYFWLVGRVGWAADAIILAAAVIVAAVPWTREHLARLLYRAHLRRRWALACRHADLATRNDRVPRVTGCTLTRAGEQLRVRIPAGSQVPDVEQAAERIAAFLSVREVRVTRAPESARYARVVVLRRDPLADPRPIPWPWTARESCSLWAPVPVGLDEDGTQVTVTLPYRNLLLGGEPDAGKSSILQLLIAVGALDPGVRLTLFDPKLVELAVWQGCTARLVGPNVDEAIDVLRALLAELDDRYLTLLANQARKVTEGDGLALHLVGVEELAFYTNGPNRKANAEFSVLLRDFVARGRAGGMVAVATTQKPSADVVPSYLRDLFGFRWALRCSTPDASDTILGRGWASQGYSAATIDPAIRGVGYLLQEGGVPTRLRACYLDDEQLATIARRAEALRAPRPAERPTLRIVDEPA
ncbi:MAG TPA: FtsK/SpoIIIE domain-containing protein [Actinomycetes bacterium]|nr:FtsK/SpoIIIE domain-containing protein [Actinomycetes bacterium]